MAAVIRSSCVNCSAVFYLKEGDIILLPTMTPRTRPSNKPYLESWSDWVYHVSHHCVECRIAQPPPSCIADLQKHMQIARQDTNAIDE